jgi:hypothetical protein
LVQQKFWTSILIESGRDHIFFNLFKKFAIEQHCSCFFNISILSKHPSIHPINIDERKFYRLIWRDITWAFCQIRNSEDKMNENCIFFFDRKWFSTQTINKNLPWAFLNLTFSQIVGFVFLKLFSAFLKFIHLVSCFCNTFLLLSPPQCFCCTPKVCLIS